MNPKDFYIKGYTRDGLAKEIGCGTSNDLA